MISNIKTSSSTLIKVVTYISCCGVVRDGDRSTAGKVATVVFDCVFSETHFCKFSETARIRA